MTRPGIHGPGIHPSARIHPTALVEPGAGVGADTAIWDSVHVRSGAVIGSSCIVGEKSYIAYGVVIGDRVKINAGVYIPTGVRIEDGVMVSAHVVFTNDRYPRAADRELATLLTSAPTETTLETRVARGATLGANATIGPGIVIGEYAMVGMGSVVTKDVLPHTLVLGNPAHIAGLVARDGTLVWRAPADGKLPKGLRVVCPQDGHLVVDAGSVRHERERQR